jgi:hypothetical protein
MQRIFKKNVGFEKILVGSEKKLSGSTRAST